MPFGYVLKPIQERDLKVTIEMALYVSKIDAERRRAEKKQHLERIRMMAILDAIPDGIYIVSQQYDIEYVNPTIHQEFGSVDGRKCYEYFHNRKKVCPWCKNTEVFAGKSVKWEWYSLKNNRHYNLFDTPFINADNSISKFEIFHDVSDLKQAEEAVNESEEKYRKLFEDSIDGYALADPETGIVTDCNQALTNLVGRTKEEIIGQHQRILHPPSQQNGDFSTTFKQHVDYKSGEALKAQLITKTGEIKNAIIRARVFEVNNKKIMHAVFRLDE